jgi:predicted AlkP superfamily pyrophosphatase or phosphodiesterase
MSMNKTVVINIVGLSKSVIGAHTPFLKKYISERALTLIKPLIPAVTTTMQSSYITGKYPDKHGIVGNGWYDREDCEIKFWKQSNKLIKSEKIWERAKKMNPGFTCSKMFWWYNMYSDADYSVTPRPQYRANGVKFPDCYSHPAQLRDELQNELGIFPLFDFWGPKTSIRSSRWIADSSIIIERKYNPTLSLIYLPHLDYCLQKHGTDFTKIAQDLREIDKLCEELVSFYEERGANIILLSEYGIVDVNEPVHINRILRNEGLINIRTEGRYELLDPGASKAFAVADHQVAHIYLNDLSVKEKVLAVLNRTKGIQCILGEDEKKHYQLNHSRSGDLIAIAEPRSWFTYYYWQNDKHAPDFARTVDIHRKPGYDPLEMFFEKSALIKVKALYKFARKKLGFRYVMDVLSLDPTIVKGSHGSAYVSEEYYPLLISRNTLGKNKIEAPEVYDVIWQHLFDS